MGGHSHWAGIKHKKAANDAKKGKVWTKVVREITIAAKMGGGDPGANPRLRKALDEARAANMPADNIKRAIQKGTGELPGVAYEDMTFEGYGPGGVAVYAEGTTDNRNRTAQEIRKIYENHGGNMGSPGCVAFLFEKRGVLQIKRAGVLEDDLLSWALDLGAEDVKTDDPTVYTALTAPECMEAVKSGLQAKGAQFESAEISMVPKTTVAVGAEHAPKILALMEALEDHDDVSRVYANFDIPDNILATLAK